MKQNKLLLTTLVILAVVVLGELLYSFSLKNKETSSSKYPAPTKNTYLPKNVDNQYLEMNPLSAYDPKVLDTLKFYKKGILQSAIVKNIHKGKIVEIDTKEGKAFYNYNYQLYIRLASVEDSKVMTRFYFSQDDLSKTKVAPPVSQLRIGDVIVIEDEFDPTKNKPVENNDKSGYKTVSWGINRVSVKITKVN